MESKVKTKIIGFIFLLFGLVAIFFGVNTYKADLEAKNNYLEVTANLVDTTKTVEYIDGERETVWKGIYSFEVEGRKYEKEGNTSSSTKSSVPDTLSLYVNKENPETIREVTPTFVYIIFALVGLVFPITGLNLIFNRYGLRATGKSNEFKFVRTNRI